jgi:hypothetical protein
MKGTYSLLAFGTPPYHKVVCQEVMFLSCHTETACVGFACHYM